MLKVPLNIRKGITCLTARPSHESLSEAINSINPPTALNKVKLWKSKEDELAKKMGLR